MASQADWIENHLKYLDGLKKLTAQQQNFIALATQTKRSAVDEKRFKVALKQEKLAAQLVKAKAEAAKIETAARRDARKARDHELYQSAGLLIMAGIVDTKTGKIIGDVEERLGSLIALNESTPDEKRREQWKKMGKYKLEQQRQSRRGKTKKALAPTTESV